MNSNGDGAPLAVAEQHLRAAIEAAAKEIQVASEALEMSKANYACAKEQLKSLTSALSLISEKDSDTKLNKNNIRPYLESLLKKGAIPGGDVAFRLKEILREKGISTVGIALVLIALRREYERIDGTWSLNGTDLPHSR